MTADGLMEALIERLVATARNQKTHGLKTPEPLLLNAGDVELLIEWVGSGMENHVARIDAMSEMRTLLLAGTARFYGCPLIILPD